MGLMVELREKMSSLNSVHSSPLNTTSRTTTTNNNNNNKPEQIRKKRTFDIAFLTGQTELYDRDPPEIHTTPPTPIPSPTEPNNNNNIHSNSKRLNSSTSTTSISYSSTLLQSSPASSFNLPSQSESEIEPDDDVEIPFNLTHGHRHHRHNTSSCSSLDSDSSSSSMIDIMTCNTNNNHLNIDNVSEESSSYYSPVTSPTSFPLQIQPNRLLPNRHLHHPSAVISVRHPHRVINNSLGNLNNLNHFNALNPSNTRVSKSPSKSKTKSAKVKTAGPVGHSFGSGPGRHKISRSNPPVKEEIRFESKRTIDINHSTDSLKIKENLQFSTLIPSSSGGSVGVTNSNQNQTHFHHHNAITTTNTNSNTTSASPLERSIVSTASGSNCNSELLLPLTSTFALFPHINMSTGNSSGSGGKYQSITLPPLAHHYHQHQQQMNNQNLQANHTHFSSSSTIKMEKSDGINLSYHQNIHHHNHHHQNQQNRIRALGFPDLYAAAMTPGGYPYPNLIIPPQDIAAFRQQQQQQSQFSPASSPSSSSPGGHLQGQQSSPGGSVGVGSTLLPPSLTALTLPAQNVCAKCNIGFRMTSDLVYHMRSHHKRDTFDPLKKQREEKLKCPVCHETFRERHHLTRHMTAHQDRVDEEINATSITNEGNLVTPAIPGCSSSIIK